MSENRACPSYWQPKLAAFKHLTVPKPLTIPVPEHLKECFQRWDGPICNYEQEVFSWVNKEVVPQLEAKCMVAPFVRVGSIVDGYANNEVAATELSALSVSTVLLNICYSSLVDGAEADVEEVDFYQWVCPSCILRNSNGCPILPAFRVYYDCDARKVLSSDNFHCLEHRDDYDELLYNYVHDDLDAEYVQNRNRVINAVSSDMYLAPLSGVWRVDVVLFNGQLVLADMAPDEF